MRQAHRHRAAVACALALSTVTAIATPRLSAQQPSRLSLGAPTAAFDEPFSRVMGLAELPDGRAVVADAREQAFFVVDARSRSVRQLGRTGPGPAEYQSAFGVVRVRGDSLYLYDARGRRYLRVAPDGAIVPSIAIPIVPGSGITGTAPPAGADAMGRIYWTMVALDRDPASGMPKRRRTQVIVRWTPDATRLDSVGVLADHAERMHAHRFHPYAERDALVIDGEGRLGVLAAADYRLRWFTEGRLAAEGPANAWTPVPIGESERDAYRAERAASPAGGARVSGPPQKEERTAPSPQQRRSMREVYPDEMFPRAMPPFGERDVLRSPGGTVWVVRSAGAGAPSRALDALDASGRLRASYPLPADWSLVAADRTGLWLVRTDDDGLQWLHRFAYPAGTR